jgi:hypothetical protein
MRKMEKGKRGFEEMWGAGVGGGGEIFIRKHLKVRLCMCSRRIRRESPSREKRGEKRSERKEERKEKKVKEKSREYEGEKE